ncbi:MAG TPA: OmpA family protein [Dongiaceae bacterium]|nr:OmpA family protein [Dongiaceae bacterium]
MPRLTRRRRFQFLHSAVMLSLLLGTTVMLPAHADSIRPAQTAFHFALNQAKPSTHDRAILEQHGRFIAEHPEVRVTLHGHSDSRGNGLHNATLALQRAKRVAQILREQGVALEQIEIVSWGAVVPAPGGQSEADDRRVELDYNDEFLANVGLDVGAL